MERAPDGGSCSCNSLRVPVGPFQENRAIKQRLPIHRCVLANILQTIAKIQRNMFGRWMLFSFGKIGTSLSPLRHKDAYTTGGEMLAALRRDLTGGNEQWPTYDSSGTQTGVWKRFGNLEDRDTWTSAFIIR